MASSVNVFYGVLSKQANFESQAQYSDESHCTYDGRRWDPGRVHYTRVSGHEERRRGMRTPRETQSPVSDAFLRTGKRASNPTTEPAPLSKLPSANCRSPIKTHGSAEVGAARTPRDAFPRQCPLGTGSHTEGAQQIASVAQKLLPSLQAQRDGTLPSTQTALCGTGFFHPTLRGEPGTLSWPAECFSLAIRNFITVSRFVPRRDTLATGRDRRREMTSSSPRGGFIMCNNADPVTFPLARQS